MTNFNKLSLSKIRNILLKKGYIIDKKTPNSLNKNIHNFLLVGACGFFLIGFFSILPVLVKFYNKNFYTAEIIENKSKMNFEKVMSGKELDLSPEEKEKVSFKDLFYDVFDFDDVSNDTVRLSAATLEQLFEETNYNLKDIRKNKIVKPIALDLLPKEIKFIESTKKRKELFIKIVLPLILEENNIIKLDRKRLFVILNKNNNSKSERDWLNKKFKQYGVSNKDIPTLKRRMDIIPPSMAIAQAAKETGWGTSRFALEGNALFGQWTYTSKGIKPANAEAGSTHKVMMFNVLKSSVRAYTRNLNTHQSYKMMRYVRAIQRDNSGELNSLELVDYLDNYAETGKEYTVILKKIIEQNSLTDFDDVKILPTSEAVKNLI